MRKILLAATAMFSVGMLASQAQAQMPAQPVTTDSFTAGQVLSGANPPPPGTVTVTLRFRDWTDVGYGSDSGTIGKKADGTPNGSKQQNFQVQNFFRIYPRLAGVAANGMTYGAQVQIRQNSGFGGSTGGSSGGTPNLGNTLFVRNASVYAGLPTVGTIYAGQASMAITQFMVGTQEDWDGANGGWNGDSPDFLSSGTSLSWPWPEDGGTYTVNRLVYISPKFSGFDFGFSFEPSYSTGAQGANSFSQAGGTTGVGGGLSSSILTSTPGGQQLRKNTYDVAARYTGSFGPVAAVIEGGYWGSGVVGNSTTAQLYKGLDLFDMGARFNIGPLEFGAHYDFGTINGAGYQPMRAGTHKENAFVGGAEYTIGQGIVGIQYINSITAGTYVAAHPHGGLHEQGVAFGGSYAYAPGAEAYLSVLYGVRHQSGADLLNGGTGNFNNTTTARAIGIGNRFDF
jgi:predicted porin